MKTLTLAFDDTRGRQWDADAIAALLAAIAEQGLRKACQLPGMPSRASVLAWARDSAEFRQALDAAREDYAGLLIDEAIERADYAIDRESAACARIQADVRLKVAAMIAPNVYGRDKGNVDTGGVVVTLLRLAAQGIQDRAMLEAVPLKPLTPGDGLYTARPSREIGKTERAEPLAAPGGGKGTRDESRAGGAPHTPVRSISPGPTNTPGDFSGDQGSGGLYTVQTARDRMVVTVPDEIDVLSGVAANEDPPDEWYPGEFDLDEPPPA